MNMSHSLIEPRYNNWREKVWKRRWVVLVGGDTATWVGSTQKCSKSRYNVYKINTDGILEDVAPDDSLGRTPLGRGAGRNDFPMSQLAIFRRGKYELSTMAATPSNFFPICHFYISQVL
jgi:hypothetical protein